MNAGYKIRKWFSSVVGKELLVSKEPIWEEIQRHLCWMPELLHTWLKKQVCFLCHCQAIRHGDNSICEGYKGSDERFYREHCKCLEKSIHDLQRCSTPHTQLFSKMCESKYQQFILAFKVSDIQTVWVEVLTPIYTMQKKNHTGVQNFVELDRISYLWKVGMRKLKAKIILVFI